MSALGDSFPPDVRANFADRNLTPGSVVRIYDQQAQKDKWLIVIGIDDEQVMLGVLRINSVLNTNVFWTDERKSLAYPLLKAKNGFLKWDSFVDCMTVVELKYDDFKTHIANNPEALMGNVHPDDFDVISSIVCQSDSITGKQISKFKIGQ